LMQPPYSLVGIHNLLGQGSPILESNDPLKP
jgi:hypothetical protein